MIIYYNILFIYNLWLKMKGVLVKKNTYSLYYY